MQFSVPETQAMRQKSNFLSISEQNLLRTMFLGSRLSSGGSGAMYLLTPFYRICRSPDIIAALGMLRLTIRRFAAFI